MHWQTKFYLWSFYCQGWYGCRGG